MNTNHSDDQSVPDFSDSNLNTASNMIVYHAGDIPIADEVPKGNFNDAIDVGIAMVSHPVELARQLKTQQSITTEAHIKDFLRRPRQVYSNHFQSSDTSTTYPALQTMAYLNSDDYFYSKVKGFQAIRATTVVRLIVNGTRFCMGRYIMAWIPSGGTSASANLTPWIGMHRYDLTQITQLPHVEIDIARDTEVILKIPYVSSTMHYPISSGNTYLGSPGTVILVPYVAFLSATGPTNAPFDVFVSYEDVELGTPMVPQSSDFISNKRGKTKVIRPLEVEQYSQNIGPLSSALRSISDAGTVLKRIPMISAVAETASWAADVAAGVALAFGLSKPANLAPANRVTNKVQPYAVNSDTADNCMPLSVTARNAVEALPGLAGTDIDEMSIDYLKSIFAYTSTVTWSYAYAPDIVLANFACNPANFQNTYTAGSRTLYTMPPIGFLSNIFRQYRGGLMFRFKIVCTEFHTGRLMVTFNPSSIATSAANPNNADSSYTLREIVDLRDGNEFCVCVPFVAITPYLMTSGNSASFGNLCLRVINPLTQPDTVPNFVQILVEVAGAPDLEFAVPSYTDLQPCTNFGLQSSEEFDREFEIYEDQVGGDDFPPNSKCLFDHVIGGSSLPVDSDLGARICVGEKILSLSSLLKRNTLLQWVATTPAINTFMTFCPFSWSTYYATSSTTQQNCDLTVDYFGLFSSIFALNRGGVRIRTVPFDNPEVTNKFVTRCSLLNNDSNAPNYTGSTSAAVTYSPPRFAPTVSELVRQTYGVEVFVPMYSQYHTRSSASCMYANSTAGAPQISFGDVGAPASILTFQNDGTTGTPSLIFYRSGADDAQFGMFVSIPLFVRIDVSRGET